MTMVYDVAIPKPIFNVVTKLTHQSEVEVALTLAIKDWIRLKMERLAVERQVFEKKWGMDYAEFKRRWLDGLIPDAYSYAVEKDYFDWEAVVTNEEYLQEMSDSLPTELFRETLMSKEPM